jgi:hypothetical protein
MKDNSWRNMFFIYGAENSRACDKAEFFLYNMNLEYRIYIFGRDYTIKQLNKLVPGTSVVPHIYHGAKYIGGVKELYNYLHSEKVINDSKGQSERCEKILGISPDGDTRKSEGDFHEE